MWSLSQNIFLYEFNAFFILTKYVSCTVAVTLRCDSLRCDSKTSMNFFFLLHSFMDRRLVPTIEQHTFFSFLIK